MNMRQHKRFVQSKVAGGLMCAFWQRRIDLALTETPEEKAARDAKQAAWFDNLWADITAKQAVRQLVEPEVVVIDDLAAVEAAAVEYVVAKVSTGEVVGTFDLKEDALALIDKHVRGKKAKLMLVGSEA